MRSLSISYGAALTLLLLAGCSHSDSAAAMEHASSAPARAEGSAMPADPAPPMTSSVASPMAPPPAIADEMAIFSADQIRAHTRFLADDLLEGRGPGTRGDKIAEQYIATQFMAMGLSPAGDGGSYFQKVPLTGIATVPTTTLAFVKGDQRSDLKLLDEIVATDETQNTSTPLSSDLVFVGHGVVAPEYSWDDYKGVDVKGKTVVMLVDDPPASSSEPQLFGGKSRTYYGRWTYKYEEALRHGAAGAILIHTDDTAGYGWNVVRNSWGRERPYVRLKPGEAALKMTSWITQPVAVRLMQMAGQDLAVLTAGAHSRSFKPVPLGVKVVGTINSTVKPVDTANVVARLEGSDPKLKDEFVLYTAHFDHLGIGTPVNGDAIYNGAIDNATGVAVLLEMARVWSKTQPRPARSILFASVTGEEGGLRGSEFYAGNPVVPAGKTAIDLNFDAIEQFGKVSNVTMLGVERTTFNSIAQKVTRAMGIRIDPDEHPEQGSYYRSDHFSLAKAGIPSFSISPGSEYVGRPKEWGMAQFTDYNEHRYHQPSDQFDPAWDFSEGVQMGQLGYWLGWEAATMSQLPTWNRGDEFLAAREKSFGH
ncbi:MAG: M28 family peptidase [Acidobacteriota bacterium]